MKHLKIYESFKSSDDWEIGDIVVSLKSKYAADTLWLHEDYKYEIVSIKHNNTTIKVKEVGYPYSDLVEYKTLYHGNSPILNAYFFKTDFITLEEWELRQATNKYNL